MGSSKNRRQREAQRRKRQDQRAAHRLERVGAVMHKGLVTSESSSAMSDALVVFAKPLFEHKPCADATDYRELLLLAAVVWNFFALLDARSDRLGGEPVILDEDLVAELLHQVARTVDVSLDDAFDLVQLLAARRHERFPDERRVVADVQVERRADTFHVTAVTTLST